jgi:DNA-binding response OmpR family regulator
MIAHSLLVSNDPGTIEQVTHAMGRLAITTEVCVDVDSARHVLNSRKFDAVAVDFDSGQRSAGLLGELRISPSNRTAPAIAITRSQFEQTLAHCAGSNFVLRKPLAVELLNRTLNAGFGLIVRERRRYFRCRARTRVMLRRIDMRETECRTVNISEGGMEITMAPSKLMPGMKVHVEFGLPGCMIKFAASCETKWCNARRHAGLQFLLMPLEQRCDLQGWLARRLEESLPQSIVERFRDTNERFVAKPADVD